VRLTLWLALFIAAPMVLAQQQRSFVACPIVRDTKTVPCFLAEYEGELYYLGIQQDITAEFHPPQLKHEVLVEGRVAEGPRVCGGIPLKPLVISVMKEVNLACNTLLPAEPGIEAPPAERGAGPSSRRPAAGRGAPAEPLSGAHEFNVPYAFDDDYLEFGPTRLVNEAAAYAKRINASRVKVEGYRATSLLSNGNRMVEKPGLAEQRAQNMATVLRGLGVANVTVEWKSDAEPADGINDPARRRVSITVTP
jgi:outer membrane protein OmpA-like peptidoglycan-associated protein